MPDRGYYERNKDKCIQQSKDSYARRKAADPKGVWLKQALHAARYRSIKQGVPFTITTEDVETVDVCPALGIPISYTNTKLGPDSPTLDKFDPFAGYVPGNVYVISCRANAIKQNAASWEVAKVAAWMESVEESKI